MATAPLLNRQVTKSIALRTDAENALSLTLRMTLDVQAPIVFKPSNRLVISTLAGEEGRRRVLLERADGEKLEVLSAETGQPSLEAVTEPVVKKEKRDDIEAVPGDVWLELVVAADAPVGSRTGKLRLATNHPAASSFEVSYVMRVRPLIESRPTGARLWTSPSGSGDGSSSLLTLSRNGGGSFKITGIGVSNPEIFSAAAVSPEPGPRQMVRVELADGLRPNAIEGTLEGWVEISTDDPGLSKFEVPVLVASSREGTRRGFPTQHRE